MCETLYFSISPPPHCGYVIFAVLILFLVFNSEKDDLMILSRWVLISGKVVYSSATMSLLLIALLVLPVSFQILQPKSMIELVVDMVAYLGTPEY